MPLLESSRILSRTPTQTSGDLLIFPCNGNALEALDCLGPAWHLLGFVDDTPVKQAQGAYGRPVFDRAALAAWPQARVLAVPGSPQSFRGRRALIEGLGLAPARWARVIHPSARISPLARIGHNVLVMAGVVVTSNAVIGDHVCLLPNTVVHHDVVIGDGSLVGAGVTLAGGVHLGPDCYIGSGSSLMNGLDIGAGTLVGLGSTVIRDTKAGSCVAGNPARLLCERQPVYRS
jgi:sugar O-acyltransferase (sialic acid O-acetyltransferase NeuD family)